MAGRARRKGVYAPLSAQYYLDDAILEAGPEAELLWVRILSFLASIPSDGFVTERQLKSVGLGLRSVPKRVRTLQEVGLLIAEPGGYVARSWLKWNKSVQEYNKELSTDRQRHASKSAEDDLNSERNPSQLPSDSDTQYRAEQSSTEQSSTSTSDADASDGGEFAPDVIRLCSLLAELVASNGHPVKTVGPTWWNACERLFRLDGYTADQVEWVMRWATANEFWSSNIRSMPKLREKFSELKARALTEHEKSRGKRSAAVNNNMDTVAFFAQQERLEVEA